MDDKPDFKIRGIMIDTCRHYMDISVIKKVMNSMMYNKMNTMHWHITDHESYPWELKSYPDLAHNTKY